MNIQTITVREIIKMPIPLVEKVTVKDNYIDIALNDKIVFEIPLIECTTPEQLLGWVMHLCDKDWVTPSVIHRVVKTACKENNLKIFV